MSDLKQANINCGECGKSFDTEYWASVNVSTNPELKEALLKQKLNVVTCPACGHGGSLEVDLLYHDMTEKLWVQVVLSGDPGSMIEEQNAAFEQMQGMVGEEIGNAMNTEYKRRVVPSYSHLFEKIWINDAGLDDRAVELLKLILVAHQMKAGDPIDGEMSFIGIDHPDDPKKKMLAFKLNDHDAWTCPWGKYEEMKILIDQFIGDEDGTKLQIVDQGFAKRALLFIQKKVK